MDAAYDAQIAAAVAARQIQSSWNLPLAPSISGKRAPVMDDYEFLKDMPGANVITRSMIESALRFYYDVYLFGDFEDVGKLEAIYSAVEDVATALMRGHGNSKDRHQAFRDAFHTDEAPIAFQDATQNTGAFFPSICPDGGSDDSGGCHVGRQTLDGQCYRVIFVYSMYDDASYYSDRSLRRRNNIVHELGHAFDDANDEMPSNTLERVMNLGKVVDSGHDQKSLPE